MASLRDVLNHIGKRVQVERAGTIIADVLAVRRGTQAFVEPKVEIRAGDVLRFSDSSETLRVRQVSPEEIRGRVDHYKVELTSG